MSNKTILAIKTRIYPTKNQRIYFHKCFGIRRFVWNYGVDFFNKNNHVKKIDAIYNHDIELHNNKPYLKLVSPLVKAEAFRDLTTSVKQYFKGIKNKPNFKSKKFTPNKFNIYIKHKSTVKINKNKVNLATVNRKRVEFKVAENLDFLNQENIRLIELTVSERNSQYFLSISYEKTNHEILDIIDREEKIGIDMGIKTMLTSYDGREFNQYNLPKKIFYLEKKIEALQRKQSKKVYGSSRYKKLKSRINKLYLKITNIKQDFINKLTLNLARNYKQINIEGYNFSETKNLKSSRRKLYRLSPSYFKSKLEYKCSNYNTVLNDIFWEPTTQTCSNCGFRYVGEEKLTLKDRTFNCKKCKLSIDRDENSAVNIYKIK